MSRARVGPVRSVRSSVISFRGARHRDMVQKYEFAATAKYSMEMIIVWSLVVTLVCPPLATCVTTPETSTATPAVPEGALSATFTPDSGYAQMRIGNMSGTNTVISLRFKTRISDGLLFFFGGPTYLAVYLQGGGLVLHLNTQGSRTGVSAETVGRDFNDGYWQQITVRRNGNTATLHDSTNITVARVTHGQYDINKELQTDQLFIGDVPDDVLPVDFETRSSFRGCLGLVRFASYMFYDPKDQDILYFHGDSFSGFAYLSGCIPILSCGLECLTMGQGCNLGACECLSFYHVVSEDPLVCHRNPRTLDPVGTTTDSNADNKDNRNNFDSSFGEDGLSIIWVIVVSVCIFVALLCLCFCVKNQSPEPNTKNSRPSGVGNEDGGFPFWALIPLAFFAVLGLFLCICRKKKPPQNAQTTAALPMTQTPPSEVAFDLNPPAYQEVVAVTDVNPSLTELSITEPPVYNNVQSDSQPPPANQQIELSNHDRSVERPVRPLSLPSSTNGLPTPYEGNQVPFEGQMSPVTPPPAYDSFMEYSKTPPGSLEALDV
ncbi:uncharacterized protein LOC118425568 isoform X1 [Branchiostoma floridae]|uniref:Uncharacterized protein LOC118425568 isoform X1 n=1 Tax=Branchiostoma floridae TaxID=7739 RepID=A0A9J7LXT0_BRAFL|nr:uncharacterized protein LOC118425568 isoform X1 [Branchiostoma floridae]